MASYDLVLEVTGHSILSYFTCGSLLRLKRRGLRLHLSMEGVVRLYCQQACGVGEMAEAILGKLNVASSQFICHLGLFLRQDSCS